MRSALVLAVVAACGHGAAPGPSASPGQAHATPPTCETLVAHLAIVFGQHDLAAADRADLVRSCEKDSPPTAERVCVMAATTPAAIDACGRDRAHAAEAKAVAPAPADPREDLLAIGGKVYTYLRQMGEAPPAAGPTPAIGACCAAACEPDRSAWTGPWQLVQVELDHPTAWSFQIQPTEGGVVVRAIGCGTPAPTLSLRVTSASAPGAGDVGSGAPP